MTSPRKPSQKFAGYKFQCQGSGRCCVSRGEYGHVYLSLKDRQRIAKFLKIATRTFTHRYCSKTDGWFHLKDFIGPCSFLRGKRCAIYPARPTQCRTWPFWPENMNAKVWNTEIASFCPGVGKGPEIAPEIVKAQVAEADWM